MDNDPWILIGGPVFAREWVLPVWFHSILNQSWPLDRIGFIFQVAPSDDVTINVLKEFAGNHPEIRCMDIAVDTTVVHHTHDEGSRTWTHDSYKKMVSLRNAVLERVTVHDPDRFFSLDSDILLEDPSTLEALYQVTSSPAVDAVDVLSFMTPRDLNFPSVMSWAPGEPVGGTAFRTNQYPYGTLFQSDIIMAAKMMTRPVYSQVRYQWHKQGEDLGWSTAATEKGFRLFCASYIYAPHIMSRQALFQYQTSGDARRQILRQNGYDEAIQKNVILTKDSLVGTESSNIG